MQFLYPYLYIVVLLFAGLLPFNFFQDNKADQKPDQGLRLMPPSTAYTKTPPHKLSNIKHFTMILNLSSDYVGTGEYARIVTYSLDFDKTNFMISQKKKSLVFRIKADEHSKILYFENEGILKRGKASWVAIVYDGEKIMLYQDGQLIYAAKTGKLGFSRWDPNYPLVLGSGADGKYCWNGSIFTFAVFSKAFTPAEIRGLPSNIENNKPLIYYNFASAGRMVADHGDSPRANLAIPRFFAPYKRNVLSLPSLDIKDYRNSFMDIFVNIMGFFPLGFLVAAHLRKKPILLSIVLSTAAGFIVSLTIELMQAFLPSHSSNMLDLACNTVGALGGCLFWYLVGIVKTTDEHGTCAGILEKNTGEGTDIVDRVKRYADSRGLAFFALSLVALSMAYGPLRSLLRVYNDGEYHTHMVLIPLISGYFILTQRRKIFLDFRAYSFWPGAALLAGALIFYFTGKTYEGELSRDDFTAIVTTAALIFWIGGFIFLYGYTSFKRSAFPFLFLIFMIPIPSALTAHAIYLLKAGTAEMVNIVFRLAHIPYVREGFVFRLPNIAIEIADECSGIRSSIALIITAVIASHMFLGTTWKKAVLVCTSIPMVIIKNTFRIATLSLLANFVDKKFITQSFLHHSGGIVFYMPALGLMWAIMLLLRKGEKKH